MSYRKHKFTLSVSVNKRKKIPDSTKGHKVKCTCSPELCFDKRSLATGDTEEIHLPGEYIEQISKVDDGGKVLA